jgi:hypothetical protein
MADKIKYYATYMRVSGGFAARVYHYDESGNNEIIDYRGEYVKETQEDAIDDAVIWCDRHNKDCECEF